MVQRDEYAVRMLSGKLSYPSLFRGHVDRFLGCPSCAFALLTSDPGRASTPHHLGALVLPPLPIRRRLQRLNNFGAQSHGFSTGFSTLHDEHHCPPCKTRLRLVVSLYREGVEPSGHQKRFQFIMDT